MIITFRFVDAAHVNIPTAMAADLLSSENGN